MYFHITNTFIQHDSTHTLTKTNISQKSERNIGKKNLSYHESNSVFTRRCWKEYVESEKNSRGSAKWPKS